MTAEQEKEIREIKNAVDRILFHMESDGRTKREGLVEQVSRIQSEVSELKVREKVLMARLSLIAVAGAALVNVLWKVLGIFLK